MRRFTAAALLMVSATAGAVELEHVAVNDAIERSNYNARLSGDGRFVVFESRDASIPEHRNRFRAVYLFDRQRKTIRQIQPDKLERSNAGPSMSGNGRYVAYHSYPLSVTLGNPPRTSDILIYDRYAEKSYIQTLGQDALAEGEALYPQLDPEGRHILFTSNTTGYFKQDRPHRAVYLFNRQSKNLEMISRSQLGIWANRPSVDPRMSDDVRFIAYRSAATNLMRLQPLESLSYHLYVLDRETKSLEQIDDPEKGFDTNKWITGRYDMDGLGRRIVFEGRRRKWEQPEEVLSKIDLFVFDRATGTVSQLTTGIFESKSNSPALSRDGRFLAFILEEVRGKESEGGLIVYDFAQDTFRKIVNGPCYQPSFSADGRTLVFESDQANLALGAKANVRSIYVVQNPFLD